MGRTSNYKFLTWKWSILRSQFHQLGPRCKRLFIMDSQFFSSFSNTNLIVWLNVSFLRKFLNSVFLFKYCRAILMFLSKSIAKYCKFMFLKRNEVLYLQAQVLRKNWFLRARAKSRCLRKTILGFFSKK